MPNWSDHLSHQTYQAQRFGFRELWKLQKRIFIVWTSKKQWRNLSFLEFVRLQPTAADKESGFYFWLDWSSRDLSWSLLNFQYHRFFSPKPTFQFYSNMSQNEEPYLPGAVPSILVKTIPVKGLKFWPARHFDLLMHQVPRRFHVVLLGTTRLIIRPIFSNSAGGYLILQTTSSINHENTDTQPRHVPYHQRSRQLDQLLWSSYYWTSTRRPHSVK